MAAAVFSRTHRHISKAITNTTPNPHLPDFTHNQLQLRKWYSRSSNFPTKTKHLHFPTATASYSSSSSSCFGFVGWYMGMIKTRPILTKSVTSAFIYSAADFSSQTIVGEDSERYSLTRTLRMAGYGLVILGPSLHFWFNLLSRAFPKRDLLSTLKKIAMGQLTFGPLMTTIFFSFNASIQGNVDFTLSSYGLVFVKRKFRKDITKRFCVCGSLVFPCLTILYMVATFAVISTRVESSTCISVFPCDNIFRSLVVISVDSWLWRSVSFSVGDLYEASKTASLREHGGESGSEIVARLKRDLLPTMINGIMYWPFCDFLTFKFIPVQLQPLVSNSFSYLWTVYMTYMANLAKVQPEDSFAHSSCHDLHGKLSESST